MSYTFSLEKVIYISLLLLVQRLSPDFGSRPKLLCIPLQVCTIPNRGITILYWTCIWRERRRKGNYVYLTHLLTDLVIFKESSRPPWYGATNAQWYTHPHLISAVLIPPHKNSKILLHNETPDQINIKHIFSIIVLFYESKSTFCKYNINKCIYSLLRNGEYVQFVTLHQDLFS